MRRTLSMLPLFPLFVLLLPSQAAAERSDAWCRTRAALAERLEAVIAANPAGRGPLANVLGATAARARASHTEECLTLADIQVIGTHNSYHVKPRPALLAALLFFDPMFEAWVYEHRPLGEQFGALGVRQIELDVFADPLGGHYGFRAGLTVVGDDPNSPDADMYAPGIKVLHVQDLDFETRCRTFVRCLEDIRDFSDANPGHLPIAVLVELKDDPIPDPVNLGFVTPLPFDAVQMFALEDEILSVLPREQLITPDDVRRPGLTLERSVLEHGWPSLGESRGRVMFLMDNGGADRLTYLAGNPNLEGRLLFTNGVPGEPDAAFVKRNDPLGGFAEIQQLVADGYLVRTRADADTVQSRANDPTRRDAALASGAQFVSSDYPEPDPSFSPYEVTLPGGAFPARCNPVRMPAGCLDAALEP